MTHTQIELLNVKTTSMQNLHQQGTTEEKISGCEVVAKETTKKE